MRVGIAHHLGWAVAVTASKDGFVVDRRRLSLIEAGLPPAPYEHEVPRLTDDAAEVLLAEIRGAVARATARALAELAAAVDLPIVSISLRAWAPDFPDDLPTLRRAPYSAMADSVLYRQHIAEAAVSRGWSVHLYDASAVEHQLAVVVGARAHEVLHGPRQRLGPPWTKEHRTALAAALFADHD
jgi:hypothetical protein